MREVRRYSDQTVKRAARHVRRAVRHLTPNFGTRARLELFVEQLVRLGLQPADVARPSGADALLAIASTVNLTTMQSSYIDTETIRSMSRKTLTIDSFVEPKTSNHAFASLNFSALETRIASRLAEYRPKFSPTWRRVIDCAMRMPEAP